MEQGPTEKIILEQARRYKTPLPERIKNAPDLAPGLELYHTAFFELTSDRHGIHQTEGPIPWTAMDRWATRHGLDDDAFDDLVYLLGRMDEVYLKFKAEKMASANKRAAKRGKA